MGQCTHYDIMVCLCVFWGNIIALILADKVSHQFHDWWEKRERNKRVRRNLKLLGLKYHKF